MRYRKDKLDASQIQNMLKSVKQAQQMIHDRQGIPWYNQAIIVSPQVAEILRGYDEI